MRKQRGLRLIKLGVKSLADKVQIAKEINKRFPVEQWRVIKVLAIIKENIDTIKRHRRGQKSDFSSRERQAIMTVPSPGSSINT